LSDELFHLRCDIDKCSPGWNIKPQLFGEVFHGLRGNGFSNCVAHFGGTYLAGVGIFGIKDVSST